MGLDMYLERFPRYKDWGPNEFHNYLNYKEWLKRKDKKCSYKEWTGSANAKKPSAEDIAALDKMVFTSYPAWDEEHKYPHEGISEDIAYWRKANAIHQWFVDRVQGGVDDCGYHDEVTREVLEELRDKCAYILSDSVMVSGKVKVGARATENGWEDIFEDGYIVINPEVCDEVMPTQSGFFFGNTDYDQWYIDSIRYTYEQACKALEETDFEKQMIYYCSSW